ncbi:hypothetical protein Chor_002926 [Crotalus horridus]
MSINFGKLKGKEQDLNTPKLLQHELLCFDDIIYSKADCWERFRKESNSPLKKDNDVICTTEYSRIVPLENGEIVISLVNGRPGANYFSPSSILGEFTKATNIRLHFLRTNTLLGHLISKAQRDPTVTRRYYYSIKDISIGGQCVCHGHADVCAAKTDPDSYRYQCECQHNTCGETCDHCCPGYNQKSWQPATATSPNLCEPCNCHGHALDCYYDREVERRKESLNLHGQYQGGGVCIDCQHNTAGINCEKCLKGYYRPYGIPITAVHGCIRVALNIPMAVKKDQVTVIGYCQCLQNVEGPTCSICKPLYWNLASANPYGCIDCQCDIAGVLSGIRECQQLGGECYCKPNVCGGPCDTCEAGYYGLETKNYFGCQGCKCDVGGSPEVVVPVTVASPKLFHLVLHYVSLVSKHSKGKISIAEGKHFDPNNTWSDQSKDIFFPLSKEPAFVTVPGKRFADSFLLGPGTWMFKIMVEGVLLVNLQIKLKVPQVGRYIIIFEYVTDHDLMYVGFECTSAALFDTMDLITRILFVVIDDMARIAVFDLLADTTLHLKSSAIDFLLHKICIIPTEDFSLDYVEPQVYCIATYSHGLSASCIPLQYEKPLEAVVLDARRNSEVVEESRHVVFRDSLSSPLSSFPSANGVTLSSSQNQITLNGRVPHIGQHVIIIHFYQPENPTFPVQVSVDGGQLWSGSYNASFCPHTSGCRSLVMSENHIEFDILKHDFSITMKIPNGRTMVLEHILVVPAHSYSYSLLHKESVIRSTDFISQCGGNSFYLVCGRRLCDDVTGKCLCPPQTVKPRCEVCVRLHFGYHPFIGCEKCNCSSKGVINALNPECNKIDGQCRCRSGIAGRRCDHCAPGSYGFPNCKPCKCNRGGTEPDICNPQTGVCLCKENVEGVQCDMCRSGSFYLDPANPKGCTTCFCFGATDICHSTNKRRVKSTDMRNWHLEAVGNAMSIPTTFNPISNSVVADVQELPPFLHNLYWVAPSSYLGNKLSSYGGYLSYQLKSFGLPSEGMALLEKRPDVQLIGREMKISYIDPNNPLPDKMYYGSVQLVEGNFRHTSSNNLVSREELMMVLSRLNGLQIRGLYFTETQRLTLGDVGLEEATSTGNGNIAYAVETCSCPPEYMGDSCELVMHGCCAPGYFGNPLKYRYCQKCNCLENGQLTKCDRLTGACGSCVITLLEDLSTMGSELRVIEFQMQSINTSAQLLGQMKHLEVRSKQLESLLNHSRSVIKTQSSKVDEMETSLFHLNQNINSLKEKAEDNYKKAQTLLNNFSKTNQRGRALISKIQSILIHIKVLLGQIDGTSTEGTSVPTKPSAKQLLEAQQMIDEMRSHNFDQQLTEAEKEKGKTQHLLDRIRNELEKRKANNQGLIKIVRDSLNKYESKLNDLHESLREAKEQTKLAENLNGENKRLLEEITKQTEEMTGQQSAIWDLLNSAKTSVSQTNSIFELFQKSKEEYESLAANLDGAKKDLDEKLKNQFLSSSKEPLVVKAEMYANSLQDLARKLDELKKNASKNEIVTCAVGAANTFENITDIIRAAEEAANKASSAADSALSIVDEKDLSGMAERLKTNSGKVLNKARETQKTLQDNIESLITTANTMIKNANNITTNVLSELDPIKAGVENIKQTYENVQITDFNKALREASRSVNNLTSMLPDLFNKITNINQQVISTSNITENINRIRELIQQARDAANKVAIPMKFNGKSGVEVRLPDILDDLKGYTFLSFLLQRPNKKEDMSQPQTSDMFVMYLGNKDRSNYIGMAIRGGHLICAYSLGGSEYEIRVTEKMYEKNTRDIALDQITFKRIYQYAELEYKHAAPSDLSIKYEPFQIPSRNSNTLLNLDPDKVVFYVGGYPPEFTPPSTLDYQHYKGCIELNSLNDRVFSLYNFKRTFNLNTTVVQPCRRYREQSAEFYFEGIGYAQIKASPGIGVIRYEQTIQTASDVGLVFFAANQDKFISLRIENDRPIFTYKVDSQPPREITNGTMSSVTEKLLVRTANFFKNGVLDLDDKDFPFPDNFQVGFGFHTLAVNGMLLSYKIRLADFTVFLRNGYVIVNLADEEIQSSKKCEIGSMHYITVIKEDDTSHFAVDIRTSSSRGMVFFMGDQMGNRYVALHLSKGRYVLAVAYDGKKIKIKSKAKYNDGQWHTVVFSINEKKMHLIIDGLKTREGNLPSSYPYSQIDASIYLGAVPSLNIQNIPEKSFVGCLRNFQVGRKHMYTYQQNNGVLPCLDNILENGVSFFNEGGYIMIENTFLISMEYRIAFNIRPRSFTGILIHAGSSQENYLTLYMEGGMLTASGNNSAGVFSLSVIPQQSLCDGQWHFVAVSQKQNIIYLDVDTNRNYTAALSSKLSTRHAQPLYFGRVPVNLETPWLPIQDVFLGCLKNMIINDKSILLNKMSNIHGVVSLEGCPVY